MVTITMNDDFTLNCDTNIIPAQHSSNISFRFEVPEEYKDAIVVPGYMYYDGCRKVESAIDNYSNGNFTLPANAFSKEGMLAIAFAITTGEETITTTIVEFEVRGSVNTSFSLPDETVWQNMLQNFMEQYMTKVYSSIIEDLIQKEQDHYQHTEELQLNVTGLIDNVNEKIENGDFIPNLQIGTVESGETASATITGEKDNPLLNLILQKGEKGEPGDVGLQGPPGPKGDNGGMTTHIVDTLPESGESTDIYFLTVGDNYIPFVFVEGKWITFSTVRPKQLLINNDFQINQRGKNQYNFNSETFGLDCWQHRQGSYYNAIIVTQIDGGGCHVQLGTDAGAGLRQYVASSESCLGKPYTAVISIDGVVYKGTVKMRTTNDPDYTGAISNDRFSVFVFYDEANKYIVYSLWVPEGNKEFDINYVDLFEGNIVYPHVKEDCAIALQECQNRVIVYNEVMLPCNFSYIDKNYDSISANLYLPTNFKGQPNISYDTKEMRSQHGGTTYTDFTIAAKRLYGVNIIRIIWKKDSGTFPDTIKDAYVYVKNLVISCELTL